MIVIAMMMAATSQPNAIHAPPSTIQRIFKSNETGDIAHLYLARSAIEIEKGGAGLIQISLSFGSALDLGQPCGAWNPIAAGRSGDRLSSGPIHATSAHREKR